MRIKHKIISSILAGTLLAPFFVQQVLAGTGVIYISPASSSLQSGSSETLSLRINPGTNVDGVQATVSYNPSLLQLNSVDNSASPFGAQLQKSYGGGTITIALGNLSGGVSSDALIVNMNFTALASSGSASLSISNANATSSGSYTNPSVAGASVNLTAPPAPAPTPPPASGTTTKTPTKSTTTSSVSSTSAGGNTTVTPLAPAKLTAKQKTIGYTTASLDVISSRSLDLFAMYGTSAASLDQKTAVASNVTSATLTLGDSQALTPGTPYYYQVIGQDADGTQTKLPVEHLMTKGFTLQVTILDSHNKPLVNQTVSLHSQVQTTTTNAEGVATFTNVAPGEHHVEYQDAAGKLYKSVVYVEDTVAASQKSANPSAQTAAVILPLAPASSTASSRKIIITVIAIILSLVIVGLAALLALAHLHKLHLRLGTPSPTLHIN